MPTKSLFLQVDGNVDPLRAAMKAGKSVLAEFGGAANDIADEVQKAFAKLGGGDVEVNAKAMEASLSRTFQRIRANAEAAANSGNGADVLKILGLADAEQAAHAAEAQVAAFRMLADGAHQAAAAKAQDAAATETDIAAARTLAVALEADFLAAREHAGALRAQAGALSGVREQLGIAANAHGDLEHKTNSNRLAQMEMMHVVRSSADSFAAGAPPMQIFAMEMGRVTEAAALMGPGEGMLGKVAKFMSGGWGIALMIGVAAITSLISAHKDETAAAKDQDDIEHLLIRSLKGEEEATKKLAQAIRDKTKAAREAIETDRERARIEFHQAQGELEQAKSKRPQLQAENEAASQALAARKREAAVALEAFKKDPSSDDAAAAAERAAISLQAAQATAERAARAWKENENSILSLRRIASDKEVPVLRSVSEGHTDEGAAIRQRAEDAEERLRRQRDREMTAAGEDIAKQRAANQRYIDGLDAVTRQRKKEEKDLADRNKTERTHLRGSDMSTADATKLIRDAGGTVTSGDRSYAKQKQLYDAWIAAGRPADNPVAPPGASAHNGAHGKHALDISGLTAAEIDEAFTAAGVHLTKILKERGHIHVEWGKGGPSAETMARRTRAGEIRDANDDRAYTAEVQQAEQRLARAKLGMADTVEARFAVELDELQKAREARDQEIEDKLAAGKYGKPDSEIAKAKAAHLHQLNEAATLAEDANAGQRAWNALLDEQLAHTRTELEGQITLLQLEEGLATTTADRKRIGLQILEYQERLARASLQNAIAEEKNPKRKADLQLQLDSLGREYGLRRQQTERQNADPVTAYMQQIKANAGDMNEALKGVEADGLKSIEDGLVGIISGTESVASAFKRMASSIIADLARIAIEKAIMSGLSRLLGGGGLSSAKFADGDLPMAATGLVPGFAGGGTRVGDMIRGPGTGTSDSILALLGTKQPILVSNGESIMTADATRRNAPWLEAMNKGLQLPAFADGRVPSYPSLPAARNLCRPADREIIYVHIDKSELFDAHVQRAAAPLAQAAAVAGATGGSADALSTLSRNAARRLPTMSRS